MVSVIIPVYNGAEFLEDCLRSVMNQTYRDIEIIVIDDGSTDESYEICKRLAKEDGRIRLFTQTNSGVSVARNKGIQEADGDFISFVDADDLLPKTSIDILMQKIDVDVDYVIGSIESFRGNKKNTVLWEDKEYTFQSIREQMYSFFYIILSPCGRIYRRSVIVDNGISFCKGLPFNEDFIFNLDYCSFLRKAVTLSAITYHYRRGGMATSVTYYPNRNEISELYVKKSIEFYGGIEYVPEDFLKKCVRDSLIESSLHYLMNCSLKDAKIK